MPLENILLTNVVVVSPLIFRNKKQGDVYFCFSSCRGIRLLTIAMVAIEAIARAYSVGMPIVPCVDDGRIGGG